jgi:uncharacterized membrane protein/protein-disulfide isomerase
MKSSLTLNGLSWRRILSFVAGVGMAVASVMTIDHFFANNYPTSIFEGSFCDLNAFFNCDSSAYSPIAQIWGVPLGYFGLFVGVLVALGAVFPSAAFERTNKTVALLNFLGVISLFVYSVLWLASLCLICAGYYVFSIASFVLFWKYGIDKDEPGFLARYFRPSIKYMATFAVVGLLGAYGFFLFHHAKKEAQSGGVAARVVQQYFSLPEVHTPSVVSPFMIVQATDRFEDAPIRIIEYGDFLCPDCQILYYQLKRLEKEFEGELNLAFQFFPLDAECNNVVDKNSHPGACELSYIAAHDPEKFRQIHDEIFDNLRAARDVEWRQELAAKYGVEDALTDPDTKDLVHRIINTGAEYEKTSDRWAHGIRSTPTMIINNRLVIGTFPYPHLRAIFKALVESQGQLPESPDRKFMENWVPRS